MFSGELYDKDHNKRCNADEALQSEDIMMMDWLIDGIVGDIPTIHQLIDHAKELVSLRGLKQALPEGDIVISGCRIKIFMGLF